MSLVFSNILYKTWSDAHDCIIGNIFLIKDMMTPTPH